VTILYVTHDQEEALRLSDRIAVFSQGEIDQIGTGPQLYSAPSTKFVASFIGDSNFIDVDVVATDGDSVKLALPGGGIIAGVPLHGTRSGNGRASLLLRPERVELEMGERHGALNGVVRDITFLGNNIHVLVDQQGAAPISVRLPFGHPSLESLKAGMMVSLSFNPPDAHAFV
jgi:putative spermidine/putrescine transport system ATP-binding protein